jgi:hypothetical protein
LENCEGHILYQELKKRDGRRLPEVLIFKIFNQIITGLEWFHDKNIAHRDIKPENIIVNFKTFRCETKIIDFGFCSE